MGITKEQLGDAILQVKKFVNNKISTLLDSIADHVPATRTINGKPLSGDITLKASDIGADASGTAANNIASHNISATAHNDIRILLTELSNKVTTLLDSDDDSLDQMSELVAYVKSNKSLIDAITTGKVNTTDIINDLTTNVSSKPLSAAQGVVLKALIDTLQTLVNTLQTELTNVKKSVSDGKSSIASAITDNGVTTAADATFATMTSNINTVATSKYNAGVIATKKGTATAENVLEGKTFTNNSSVAVTGTMTNNGSKTASLNCGESFTIPKGFHDGTGKITANALASQTDGTATATQILKGKTAYVDGIKVTGTMTDYSSNVQTVKATGGNDIIDIPDGYHTKIQVNSTDACQDSYNEGVQDGISDTKKGTAVAANVLAGKTFTNSSDVNITGTMADYSSNPCTVVDQDVDYGNEPLLLDIPAGYHTKIKIDNVQCKDTIYEHGYDAGQSDAKQGTATTANVLKGKTFTSANGIGLTGAMTDYSSNVQTIATSQTAGASTVLVDIPDGYHTKIKVDLSNTYFQGRNDGIASAVRVTSGSFQIGSNTSSGWSGASDFSEEFGEDFTFLENHVVIVKYRGEVYKDIVSSNCFGVGEGSYNMSGLNGSLKIFIPTDIYDLSDITIERNNMVDGGTLYAYIVTWGDELSEPTETE